MIFLFVGPARQISRSQNLSSCRSVYKFDQSLVISFQSCVVNPKPKPITYQLDFAAYLKL